MDLVLDNLQRLIYHKTQTTNNQPTDRPNKKEYSWKVSATIYTYNILNYK